MGSAGSGRQKASGASDAYIRVTTVLDGADQVVDSFEGMTNAAERYNTTITQSTGLDADAAEMHYELATAVKKESAAKKDNNVESAASIIIAQGAASALNQVTGGMYKSIGALEHLNYLSEEQAEKARSSMKGFEALAGGLEVILGIYTLKIAADVAMAASTDKATASTVANTAAVHASKTAYLTHPVVALIAAILIILYLVYKVIQDIVNHTENWERRMGTIKQFFEDIKQDMRDVAEMGSDLFGSFGDVSKLLTDDQMRGA